MSVPSVVLKLGVNALKYYYYDKLLLEVEV